MSSYDVSTSGHEWASLNERSGLGGDYSLRDLFEALSVVFVVVVVFLFRQFLPHSTRMLSAPHLSAQFMHANSRFLKLPFPRVPAQSRGGAIANFGGKLVFNAASLFEDNYASSSGDGGAGAGIYTEDGGDIT